jgi:hypothetical protein
MGWDAYADPLKTVWGFEDGYVIGTRTGDPEFDVAVQRARAATLAAGGDGTVDGLLMHGGLDVSTCGRMLSAATGRDVYEDWSPELVQELARTADWSIDSDGSEWAKQSAKAFLERCAELGRGIRFSY